MKFNDVRLRDLISLFQFNAEIAAIDTQTDEVILSGTVNDILDSKELVHIENEYCEMITLSIHGRYLLYCYEKEVK